VVSFEGTCVPLFFRLSGIFVPPLFFFFYVRSLFFRNIPPSLYRFRWSFLRRDGAPFFSSDSSLKNECLFFLALSESFFSFRRNSLRAFSFLIGEMYKSTPPFHGVIKFIYFSSPFDSFPFYFNSLLCREHLVQPGRDRGSGSSFLKHVFRFLPFILPLNWLVVSSFLSYFGRIYGPVPTECSPPLYPWHRPPFIQPEKPVLQ